MMDMQSWNTNTSAVPTWQVFPTIFPGINPNPWQTITVYPDPEVAQLKAQLQQLREEHYALKRRVKKLEQRLSVKPTLL